MPERRTGFTHKLLEHIDRLDHESIRTYIKELYDEKDLFDQVLQELEEGVVLSDERGQILFLNRSASSWYNAPLQNIQKTKLYDFVDDASLTRFIREHLKNLPGKIVQDFRVLNPREGFLRIALIPLSDLKAKTILMIISDITGRKTKQSEQERFARIEGMVKLAAGLAHEIGNPLNSFVIHLELLKKEIKTLPAAKRAILGKNLNILTTETNRLDKIVRQFLKATRKPPLRFKMEDLNSIVEEAVNFMRPEFAERKMTLEFRPDKTLVPFLMDRERLYPVFINLIKNAMEAMDGGGMVKILSSHKDNVAILRFQDNGRGIPEKDLPHIFEAYFTTKEEGSGLGLMSVYNHIAEHGGKIEVISKVGKGTTFTLLLPMHRSKLQLTNETEELSL